MGLCKCPKRQVTTQFCFEHRVNVCENCMVVNHTKCTVQSYIQWLKDSDFDSNCTLCGSPRGSDDCVRLICYHVFHWKCLNARQQLLPPNTAPGGHTCPICNDPIFPSGNLVSPVADVLRVRLGQVNWGRNELGLPLLLDERGDHSKSFTVASTNPVAATPGIGVEVISAPNGATAYGGVHGSLAQIRAAGTSNAALLSGKERPDSPHSIVNLDQYANVANSRRTTLLSREPPIGGSDRDDNKYKRRTPQEIFSRWSRRLYTPSARPVWRKNWLLVVMGLIAIVCIVYIMAEIMTADRSGSDQHGFIPNRNLPHAEE